MTAPSPVSRVLQDPRNTITEDVFRLDPALLGTPLARPWRRAAAMAVDGLLVAILANAPSVLFGFAAALVLFRASAGSARGGFLRRSARLVFRAGGAVVLFAVAVSAWDRVGDAVSSWGEDEAEVAGSEAPPTPPVPGSIGGRAGLVIAADLLALTRAEDDAEARTRAARIVEAMRTEGVPEEDIRDALEGVSASGNRAWLSAVADSLLGEVERRESAERLSGDSLALALAAALEAGDTAEASALRERLGASLAADSLARLRAELREARRESDRLEEQRDAAREEAERGGGILRMLRTLADDLGLGFGWTGLYFTASLALWKGYTPGKRLFRIRVIRLDGKPIGWWAAFERFGGYAASIATGLLGFFQILWDRNRQGIHDKIAETVVIDS